MRDDERRASIESGYTWTRMFIWVIALAAVLFAQAHPQQLGRAASDGVFMSVGSLLVIATWLDVRSGTSTLCLSTFKRSEDSTGFWTYVAINGAIGGLMFFGALGDLLGLWHL